MSSLQQRTDVIGLEYDLAARLESLFQRCPALHGFTVQPADSATRERALVDLQGGLYLADVVWHQPLNGEQAAALVDEISQALLELVDERPEAGALLRGRTFARILH